MPFDGIVVKSITLELSEKLIGGRIDKIFQPERDEVIITIRSIGRNFKLLLSSSANHPRIHLTDIEKDNPITPPAFCMLLRKHLSGGRIVDVGFYDYERIVSINVESYNDLGDLTIKKLLIEIMGRYSNIILVNEDGRIIDSIRRISNEISSVREVLPGLDYIMPPSQNKKSLVILDPELLLIEAQDSNTAISKFILSKIKGFSPAICSDICARSGIDTALPASKLSSLEANKLKIVLFSILSDIKENRFIPCVFYDAESNKPLDFHSTVLTVFAKKQCFESISKATDTYFAEIDLFDRIRQKKASMVKVISNNLDRCLKKKAIQEEKLLESQDRDKHKLYGELILSNIYNIEPNAKNISVLNYYSDDGEYINIPLNPNKTAQQNAQAYYKKYNKSKSAYIHLNKQLNETIQELSYLESVQQMLDNCTSYNEVEEIRHELYEQGYITFRKQKSGSRKESPSKPHHYRSSDGFDIYVGKNNKQNDLLTLKQSQKNDLWFHAQKIPGSHVIIKTINETVPKSTLLEAAMLSAFFSKARSSSNVPVDFTEVKNVKKPSRAKPGMVIYENYSTISVTPEESKIATLAVPT